jgi:hypothetical protein
MTEVELEQLDVDAVEDYFEELYNINSWGADISFRELITMYDEEEMLKPEFQRNYVWDKNEASRFIESILMGLPVPSIFLAKVSNEKKLIIDGYQRIMTVYDYVQKGIFSKDNKVFKLSNSTTINPKWRNKAFSELDETEKRRIKSYTIHAIIFEQRAPKENDTSLFHIFERINSNGRALLPQEIRNCVYQGSFNTLLIELNKLPAWRKLFGSESYDSRMKDIELILRYFTLSSENILNSDLSQISLKKELNLFMGNKRIHTPDFIKKCKLKFTVTMNYILDVFGEGAFHNVSNDGGVTRFNPAIFDAISIATTRKINFHDRQEPFMPDLITTNERRLQLLNDQDFKIYSSERTTRIAHIKGRLIKAEEILYGEIDE